MVGLEIYYRKNGRRRYPVANGLRAEHDTVLRYLRPPCPSGLRSGGTVSPIDRPEGGISLCAGCHLPDRPSQASCCAITWQIRRAGRLRESRHPTKAEYF